MEADLFVRPDLTIPGGELEWAASRASGAGGQHVNKTSTRVTLSWCVSTTPSLSEPERARVLEKLGTRINAEGFLLVHVEDARSQWRNRELARERLAELVRGALHVAKPRKETKIPRAVQEARLESKRRRSAIKRARQGGHDD
jgi:ribosome-associated protein